MVEVTYTSPAIDRANEAWGWCILITTAEAA